MLLTETQAGFVAWGIGGILIGCGLIGAVLALRSDRKALVGACLVLVLGGCVFAISKYGNGTRVLVMRGDARSYARSDLRLYGSTSYAFANGQSANLAWLRGRHVVVNDTPRTLKVQAARYGAGLSSVNEIPPYQSRELGGIIRHFGPADAPPGQSAQYEIYWLYW